MTDDEAKDKWSKVTDPKVALQEILEHHNFMGFDPYYSDLRNALLEMAERCAK